MTVDNKIFLIFILATLSLYATAQEESQGYEIDSIRVKLYDYNNSTFFDYCYEISHVFVWGEKTIDSISKPERMNPYKMYHEYKELRWEVLTVDTIASFVNYAMTFVADTMKNWIVECDGIGYETDKMHLDVSVYRHDRQLRRRIVFEPNCRYELFINEYVTFLKGLGWL